MNSIRRPLLATSSLTPATSAASRLDRRGLLLGGLALVGSTGCGYILHPERRGRGSGTIDGTILIFDLLWLLPGLLPGVVALAVDFTSGGIYGTATAIEAPKISRVDDGRGARVEVSLDGAVVATGVVEADRIARLEWTGSIDERALRERGLVRVRGLDGEVAEASARGLLEAVGVRG